LIIRLGLKRACYLLHGVKHQDGVSVIGLWHSVFYLLLHGVGIAEKEHITMAVLALGIGF